MNVKVINQSKHPLPTYETKASAGLDVRAKIDAPIELKPLERALIKTGIFLEIPEGYECQVRPRSGLAYKNGITVLNSPGTIDADYRGELKVILINLSSEPQLIEHGDRIAQMVFQKVEIVDLELSHQLNETTRNAGGFGHTGIK